MESLITRTAGAGCRLRFFSSPDWQLTCWRGDMGFFARVNDSETVVFESVGMPIWDTVATAWAYRWAVEQGAGVKFSLA